ncbi:MAG: hypothetical protein GEU26_00875 [Nitrososphaeraceae archaeon]|nr:hypothetical protein [Nitrososphaeraceae archaeon]
MNEEIIFVGSAIAGSFLTIAIDRLVKPAFSKANKNTQASYESVKTELNSLEFERDLVAESALKVDEAFTEKRIDSFERDKLLRRYTTQIEQYDEKIEKYQNMLDFADLRNQRDNITDMMNRRMSSIDQKLKEINNRFAITYEDRVSDRIEKVVEKAVQDNLHDSKHNADELTQFQSSTSSTQILSQPLVDDRSEVRQLEDLHHQIMLELDRFEQDEKKNDESNVSDSVDDLKSSATLVQIEEESEPVPLKDEETVKEQK